MTIHDGMTIEEMAEKVRKSLYIKTEPVIFEVEKGAIQRYAQYTGETERLFFDEDHARKGRFGGIIAPPTFLSWFLKGIVPDRVFDYDVPLPTVLHTDDIVEHGDYIRPGDRISAVGELTDVFIREGRNGPMLFETGDVTLHNQNDAFVGLVRTISVLF